ncbi:MAG: LLM class F420-dependent oxidoreductase [Acidimicrobiia bacterium]
MSSSVSSIGVTIPLEGVPLADHQSAFAELAALGYSELWSSEAMKTDAFTPVALAAAWAPTMRLGTAIVPAFTRAPAVMAQSVAAMAEAAPGRFTFGIGTSSNVIVEGWNGVPFERPFHRTRDMVRFLKRAFTGEKVDMACESFTVKGFRLGRVPEHVPPILVAALRPGMLRMAGRESDGTIINWLSADDVARVQPEVGDGKQIVARIFVIPSTDEALIQRIGRFAITSYLNVPVYAAFHEWLGRGPALQPMWDAWRAGDRKGALAAIPDSLVHQLIVSGTPEQCRDHIGRYVANGVTTPVLELIPGSGIDPLDAYRMLAS